jgi:uroporphyrinogen decarboxylase
MKWILDPSIWLAIFCLSMRNSGYPSSSRNLIRVPSLRILVVRDIGSKEIVLEALSHRETCRVPADFWGTSEVTDMLQRHFGVASKEGLLEKMGVDLRYVFPDYVGPRLKTCDDGSHDDIWGVRRKTITRAEGSYEHTVFSPLSSIKTTEDLEEWSPPSPDWYDYSSLRSKCQTHSKYATVFVGDRTNRTCVLHEAIYLRGVQQALIDPLRHPQFTHSLYEKITEFYLAFNRRCFEEAGDLIDIFMMGEDLGTQEGLLVSPRIFRQFIKPYLARHVRLAKRYNIRVMLHSCGAIRELIPELIEIGIDILNPIQVRAKGMKPAELKREFGSILSFHGGIDIQKTLPHGRPEDVRAEVRNRVQTLGKGGGYILCSTHNIQSDTPIENILAMYEEAKKQRM